MNNPNRDRPATNKERQDSFRVRQERAGLRRVEVWVPEGTQAKLKAFVATLIKKP